MIAPITRRCRLKQYSPAWALGTGLRTALAPGEYEVTGEDQVGGRLYLRLANSYRIDSRELPGEQQEAARRSDSLSGLPLVS